MNDPTLERHPIEFLASEFTDRLRAGEQPTVQQYVEDNPHVADEIRDLFLGLFGPNVQLAIVALFQEFAQYLMYRLSGVGIRAGALTTTPGRPYGYSRRARSAI